MSRTHGRQHWMVTTASLLSCGRRLWWPAPGAPGKPGPSPDSWAHAVAFPCTSPLSSGHQIPCWWPVSTVSDVIDSIDMLKEVEMEQELVDALSKLTKAQARLLRKRLGLAISPSTMQKTATAAAGPA